MFPILEGVAFCSRRHVGPTSTVSSTLESQALQDFPYMGCMCPPGVTGLPSYRYTSVQLWLWLWSGLMLMCAWSALWSGATLWGC